MHCTLSKQEQCGSGSLSYAIPVLLAVTLLAVVLTLLLTNISFADADDVKTFDDGTWVPDEDDPTKSHYVYYHVYEIISESEKTVRIYECNTLNIKDDYTVPGQAEHNFETYTVVSIGKDAYKGCTYLKSLTICDTITEIQNNAFSGCTSLREIKSTGSANQSIGDQAFNGCTSLVSVYTNDDSLISIGIGAFSGCYSLRTVRLGNSVSSIGDTAFMDCYRLVEICNNSLLPLETAIGKDSFGCIAKYAVNIYKSGSESSILKTEDLGESGIAVYYTGTSAGTSLVAVDNPGTSITLPNALSGKAYTIRMFAFSYTTNINSITLGSDITEIGNNAFRSCTDLSSITLNAGLSKIGDSAFLSCSNLRSVTIPDTVIELGSEVFMNCLLLSNVSFGSGITYVPNFTFSGCVSMTSFDYGDQITAFCNGAFQNCTSLSSITVKNNVIAIMNNTFSGCTKLVGSASDIRVSALASSVPTLGNDAFPKGTYIVVPSEKLSDYKTGWSQYSSTIVGDTFDVVFMNESSVFHSYKGHYGDGVVLPSTQPTKTSTEEYDYKFKSWDGYTEGMKVTGNLTFNAVYEEISKDIPGSDSGNNNTTVIIIIAVAVVILAAIVSVFLLRKKKGQS